MYGLDSFIVRGEAWRVSGWCAGVAPVVAAELRTGSSQRFPLTINIAREDVRANPSAAHAGHPGFFGFGTGWPRSPRRVELHLTYGNGGSDVIDVTRAINRRRPLAVLKRHLVVAWLHMRRGRHELLAAKLVRLLRRKLPKSLPSPAPAADRAPLSLVIDHDLGGGANKFGRQLLDDLRMSRKNPVRLIYSISALRFELQFAVHVIVCESLEAAFDNVIERGVSEIHLNSSVSYPLNDTLLRTVRELARVIAAPIYCYVHDYYAACPSFNLIDWRERYCGVPDTQICNRQCLPQINNMFVRSQAQSDIVAWRREWEQLLLVAREVRFFSQASFEILLKAFPKLPVESCLVSPHRIEAVSPTRLHPRGITIAIVGDLNMAKGAKRVRDLCDHIARTNAPVKVVIVGTIDEPLDHRFVRMIGPYDSSRLGTILSKAGAGVAFFPSIWPETFSYVVSELIQQRLPVVAFDLGAPAEHLASCAQAALVPLDASPAAVLSELTRLALTAKPF